MVKPVDIFWGSEREHARETKTCFFCKGPATEFKDELSAREYEISYLCQTCQDEVFSSGLDDSDV